MTSSLDREEPQAILRHRPFVLFWFARVATMVAFQMQAVAVGWQIYALTGSALYLGLVGLAQFLPMFLLTLAVGHVADRYDRRAIARLCQFVQGFAAFALAWGSAAGWQSKETILIIMFVVGAVHAFEGPTMQSLLPGLVSGRLLTRALALSASAMQTATIVGPALVGLLYTVGPTEVYAAAGLLFLAASVFLGLIRAGRAPIMREPASIKSIFAGIAFIRSRPDVLGAISLDLFAVLLGGATALLPIYARDILMTGPWGLGFLRSAPAVGALAMSLFLARRQLKRRVGRTMFISVAIFGVATVVFGLSKSFFLSLTALAVLG